jgi:hypothetical protein
MNWGDRIYRSDRIFKSDRRLRSSDQCEVGKPLARTIQLQDMAFLRSTEQGAGLTIGRDVSNQPLVSHIIFEPPPGSRDLKFARHKPQSSPSNFAAVMDIECSELYAERKRMKDAASGLAIEARSGTVQDVRLRADPSGLFGQQELPIVEGVVCNPST